MIKTRFVLPVLAATSALALIAGCGSDSSSSSSDPASIAPPTAPLYVEATVQPEGKLAENVDELVKNIAGIENIGDKITSEITNGSDESIDFAKEIEPWLGEKAGVFLQKYDGNDFNGYGVAFETTNADKAQEFLEKNAESEDGPVTKGSFEGFDYVVEADGDTLGVINDLAVFAEDEEIFKEAVEASDGESLADADTYTSAISRAPDGSLADVFVDIGGLVKQSGGTIDPEARQVLKSTGLNLDEATAVASLVPGADQVEIDVSSDLGDTEVETAPAADLLGSLPSTSFAAFASSEFGKNLEEGIDSIDAAGIPGEIPPNQFKDGLKSIGLDLEKIASSFEDIAVFATGNSESTLAGAVVITTKSGSEAKNTVAGIGTLLRATKTPGVTAITGKASGFSVRSEDLGSKPLVVAAEGERIAIGYGLPATTLGLTAKSANTLSSLPLYKEAVDALGGTAITGFVNGPATMRLVESLVPSSEEDFQEAKPYLKKASYLAIGSSTDGDVATAKLILGLEK